MRCACVQLQAQGVELAAEANASVCKALRREPKCTLCYALLTHRARLGGVLSVGAPGVAKDPTQAHRWFSRAAEAGDVPQHAEGCKRK